MRRAVVTSSEAETARLGCEVASLLTPGAVVLLTGELGAGKTAFVRGLAEGLGVPADEVSSPTFALVHEYRGRMPLFHVDLYRVSAVEAEDLGLDELGQQGVVAVEWAAKLARAPDDAIEVHIEDLGGATRRVTMVVPGA